MEIVIPMNFFAVTDYHSGSRNDSYQSSQRILIEDGGRFQAVADPEY